MSSPVDVSPPDASTTMLAISTACDLPPAQLQDLLGRWDAAADSVAPVLDFHWPTCDKFPHPTFKGGTEDAYGQFASVLLQFFEQGDDFALLGKENLFHLSLQYVFPSGQVGVSTTFKELASSFSDPGGFGDQSAATRQALAGFLARIP